jgi:hypothetical protein
LNLKRGWGLFVDLIIIVGRFLKHWKYYIRFHEYMAFLLNMGSILAICLILDYKGGIQPSSTTKSHKFIGIFMMALISFHRKDIKIIISIIIYDFNRFK